MIIYLCGAINGCTDTQAKDWREAVKSQLAGVYDFLDPMHRDYRGKEDESVNEIVHGDEADLVACDIVLAAADVPSWGTGMEIRGAYKELRKRVIVICGAPRVSPWLRYHSHQLVPTLHDAIAMLGAEAAEGAGTRGEEKKP